jgi:hypothetical protein
LRYPPLWQIQRLNTTIPKCKNTKFLNQKWWTRCRIKGRK